MKKAVSILLLASVTSCASIVSKSDYPVTFDSEPTGAELTIRNEKGEVIQSGTAPMTVTLSAKKGFFSAANYSIDAQLAGYEAAHAELSGKLDNCYWGNILLGGLIGMLIVDPITGAMWKLPERLVVPMAAPTP